MHEVVTESLVSTPYSRARPLGSFIQKDLPLFQKKQKKLFKIRGGSDLTAPDTLEAAKVKLEEARQAETDGAIVSALQLYKAAALFFDGSNTAERKRRPRLCTRLVELQSQVNIQEGIAADVEAEEETAQQSTKDAQRPAMRKGNKKNKDFESSINQFFVRLKKVLEETKCEEPLQEQIIAQIKGSDGSGSSDDSMLQLLHHKLKMELMEIGKQLKEAVKSYSENEVTANKIDAGLDKDLRKVCPARLRALCARHALACL